MGLGSQLAHPVLPILAHRLCFNLNEQLAGVPFRPDDRAAIKFTNFWTIETEPGVALLVTHPLNREDLPFRTLSGLVDTDKFTHGIIQFPALWLDVEFSGVLEKGLPIAQCIPVRRDHLDLEFGELVDEHASRFEEIVEAVSAQTGVYRKRFRVAKP